MFLYCTSHLFCHVDLTIKQKCSNKPIVCHLSWIHRRHPFLPCCFYMFFRWIETVTHMMICLFLFQYTCTHNVIFGKTMTQNYYDVFFFSPKRIKRGKIYRFQSWEIYSSLFYVSRCITNSSRVQIWHEMTYTKTQTMVRLHSMCLDRLELVNLKISAKP